MQEISAYILTFNEAEKVKAAVESVLRADEVVAADSNSTDGTAETHKRVSMAGALSHGPWSFLKHYIFKLGFIDGWAGFVIAFGNFEGTSTAMANAMRRRGTGHRRRASRRRAKPRCQPNLRWQK